MYDIATLRWIFERTCGRCHLCNSRLVFALYPLVWKVDHSRPRSRGGTDRLSNLLPACVFCNRSKGAMSTRTTRAQYGGSRMSLSRWRQREAREDNTVAFAFVGGLLGLCAGCDCNKIGRGAMAGAIFGAALDPEQTHGYYT